MKKLRSIESFAEGDKVQGFYLCVSKHLRYTRTGDLYIDLELRDNTGHISGKIWNNVSESHTKFDAGNAVVISGNVESFLDHLHLVVKKINKATVQHYGRYGFDPANIVPTSKKDPQKMWKEIKLLIGGIKDKELRKLVSSIYKSNQKKLMVHPSSIKMNHSYRSGFLEHVLSMAKIAKKITSLYDVDRDLVISGTLIKNIGRLNEINSEYQSDNTFEGHLIGHKVMSRDIVMNAIGEIKDFPKTMAKKIEHILISDLDKNHSNHYRIPSFPEALLIHLIDFLDSEMSLMDISLKHDQESGSFTNHHNYFRTPLLKKNEPK